MNTREPVTVLFPNGTAPDIRRQSGAVWKQCAYTFWLILLNFVAGNSPAQISSGQPPPGLVGWWAGEGNARDLTTNHNDGAAVGSVTYAPGVVGQAFSFDGSSGYVQLPANLFAFPFSGAGTTPFCFELWFRTASGGVILGQQQEPFVPFQIPPNYVPAIYVGTDGRLRSAMFWDGGANGGALGDPITATNTVCDGNFHHLAVVYDGTNQMLYVDSKLAGGRAWTQLGYATGYNYQFGTACTGPGWPGGNGGWYSFIGLIDEAALFNRALSADEIAGIYAAGRMGMSWPGVSITNVLINPGGGAALQWYSGLTNFCYVVENCADLGSKDWTAVEPTLQWPTANRGWTNSIAEAAAQKFFRVRAIPIPTNPAVAWTEATGAASWSARGGFAFTTFSNKMWVLGGSDGGVVWTNDVWSSSNGLAWTPATTDAAWNGRAGHGAVALNGQIWVFGGGTAITATNDVWSSSNGVTWSCATVSAQWGPRDDFASLVFNGQMWLLGGYDGTNNLNAVWSSSDGVHWTQATASAGWSPRRDFSAVAFHGRIWVMGGYDGSLCNDVWTSADGSNWTRQSMAAAWRARDGFGLVSSGGKLWVFGGTSNGGLRNDVWSSSDGVIWMQATSPAPWTGRAWLGSLAFDGQIWMLGGRDGAWEHDVWSGQ